MKGGDKSEAEIQEVLQKEPSCASSLASPAIKMLIKRLAEVRQKEHFTVHCAKGFVGYYDKWTHTAEGQQLRDKLNQLLEIK